MTEMDCRPCGESLCLMTMWHLQTTNYEGGRPLLDALALRIPAAPRGYLHQLIRKGRVQGDGHPLADGSLVTAGMHLLLPESRRLTELAGECGIPPATLLYEDQSAMVVDKPAGLPVHRAAGHDDDLTSRVARFIILRRAPYRVAPVHRLDVGTSGPVLFGKGREATGQLGQALMAGRIGKHYLALVARPTPPGGELTTPVPDGAAMKPALTRYRRLAATERFTLLALELFTGRPHQIRRQLSDAGWPIVGDSRYGGPPWPGLAHPFLHCRHLTFPALDTGETVQVASPLPASLRAILASIMPDDWQKMSGTAENPAASGENRL